MGEFLAFTDNIARLIFSLVYLVITLRRAWREDWPGVDRGLTVLIVLSIWAAVSP